MFHTINSAVLWAVVGGAIVAFAFKVIDQATATGEQKLGEFLTHLHNPVVRTTVEDILRTGLAKIEQEKAVVVQAASGLHLPFIPGSAMGQITTRAIDDVEKNAPADLKPASGS